MKLAEKDLKGRIKNLPLKVAQEAYDAMKLQNSDKDIEYLHLHGISSAFTWGDSPQGADYWINIFRAFREW